MEELATGQADTAIGPGSPVATSSPAPATRAHSAPARLGLQTFSSLRHRDYRYLWTGTMFMSAGQWIQQVTLGWLLYDMTGSSVLLGALNGLRSLPFLVSSPVAGVAADRMDRRKLILGSQAILLVTAFGMGALVVSGLVQVWHLFVFTLLTGLPWAFTTTVRQTLVPTVVPKQDLMNAVALSSTGFNLTKVLGPALAGLLIAWFGAGGNFFVQAGAYAGVLAMIFLMRVPPMSDQARQSSVAANLKEGLGYIWSNPVVRGLIAITMIPNVLAMPVYQSLMPVFQKDVLGLGPEALGLLLAAPGLGAVLSTLLLATIAHHVHRKGLVLLGGLLLQGVCVVLFSQAPSLHLALLALVGVGSSQLLFSANTNTLLQLTVPDALRGRVMSIYLLDNGLSPAGAMVAGVLTHFLGAPTSVALMGGVMITLALLVAWRSPRIREIET
ncbi:MAG: MFS transporter [Chloroflexi bacterium]|nr:MFS transporter [Chloroflexota bacterium]